MIIILLGLLGIALFIGWIIAMVDVHEDKNKVTHKSDYQIFKENKLSK